jgi:uncharacterized protein YndB with AHSA1/START domain
VKGAVLARLLQTVCVVFTASLVLFVLANVVVAYLYPRDTRAVLWGQPVFNENLRAVHERIYGLPIATVREIVAESYMENSWIFEPYVQFREQPRSGRYVNVSPDGFRLNSAAGVRRLEPMPLFGVFLFGGSTTFGYGVRDEDTIAAHLEALLRRRHPDQAHLVAVYNFGRGYYGSSQEALLLKSLLLRGIVPGVAVFIDGVNEQFCPTYSANMAEVFKILQHDPAAKLREVVASLPVMRLAGPRFRTELATNALYVNRTLERYAFECRCPRPEVCHMQLVRTYALNKELVRTMAKEFDFEAHFVLQPVGGYRNRFTTAPDGAARPDHSWFLWGMFERHALTGENDHSFAGILEHYPQEAFIDLLHYTSGVNRLIAELLYERLAPAMARTLNVVATGRLETAIQIAVDPATAFAYFTDPAKVVRWMGRSAQVRPVPGGEFHVQMTEDRWIRATVVEAEAPRRLVLSWRWETKRASGISRVEISFAPRQGGSLVRIVHSALPSEVVPLYRDGWMQHLDRLSLAASGRNPDTGRTGQSQK